jgi:hypothetical protein
MPMFSHTESDIATFRMITSQCCLIGHVKRSDFIRPFEVTSISDKRSVKIYREKGPIRLRNSLTACLSRTLQCA